MAAKPVARRPPNVIPTPRKLKLKRNEEEISLGLKVELDWPPALLLRLSSPAHRTLVSVQQPPSRSRYSCSLRSSCRNARDSSEPSLPTPLAKSAPTLPAMTVHTSSTAVECQKSMHARSDTT